MERSLWDQLVDWELCLNFSFVEYPHKSSLKLVKILNECKDKSILRFLIVSWVHVRLQESKNTDMLYFIYAILYLFIIFISLYTPISIILFNLERSKHLHLKVFIIKGWCCEGYIFQHCCFSITRLFEFVLVRLILIEKFNKDYLIDCSFLALCILLLALPLPLSTSWADRRIKVLTIFNIKTNFVIDLTFLVIRNLGQTRWFPTSGFTDKASLRLKCMLSCFNWTKLPQYTQYLKVFSSYIARIFYLQQSKLIACTEYDNIII